MLRLSELTDRIAHLPRILYHWRKLPGSIASSPGAKDGIAELQAAAVARHLERLGVAASVRPNPAFPHRAIVQPAPRGSWPRVTVDRPDEGRARAPRPLPRLDLRPHDLSELRRHSSSTTGRPTLSH